MMIRSIARANVYNGDAINELDCTFCYVIEGDKAIEFLIRKK